MLLRFKRLLCIIFISTFTILTCYSQNINLVISGKLSVKNLEDITITKAGINFTKYNSKSYTFPIGAKLDFKGYLSFSKKGFYILNDGVIGHKMFFEKDDSIKVLLSPKKQTSKQEAFNVFNSMKVSGKYWGNYCYFDSVSSYFGNTVHGYNQKKFDATRFKATCDLAYNKALQLLANFQNKGAVSDSFVIYAKQELLSNYVLWICTPLTYVAKGDLPPNYLENIENLSFNDFVFMESLANYSTAAYVFNMYVLNTFNPKVWYSNFREEFNSGFIFFQGQIRDRILGWCIKDYKDKGFEIFDSLYNVFLKTCTTESIKEEVMNNIEKYLEKETTKPTFDSVLSNTLMFSFAGKKMYLKDFRTTEKGIVLIDCWASWCMPCKRQLPYTLRKATKYKKSISFLYLSFDQDVKDWKKIVKRDRLNLNSNFIIKDSFKSIFSKLFSIETIPRYILIDFKNKKILQNNLPLPESIEFDTYLQNAIANNN